MSSSATFFSSSPNDRRPSELTLLRRTTWSIRGHGDNQVRKLKASVLLALADERISFAKYFSKDGSGVLGHAAI